MNNKKIPFESHERAKCLDCGTKDTLDAMVRKNNEKGQYHCKDCETDQQEFNYFESNFLNKELSENRGKLNKLMNWCLG